MGWFIFLIIFIMAYSPIFSVVVFVTLFFLFGTGIWINISKEKEPNFKVLIPIWLCCCIFACYLFELDDSDECIKFGCDRMKRPGAMYCYEHDKDYEVLTEAQNSNDHYSSYNRKNYTSSSGSTSSRYTSGSSSSSNTYNSGNYHNSTYKTNSSSSKSSGSTEKYYYCDPEDYDTPEDYADDAWGYDFDDWDDAYDYWEDY